MLKSPVIVQIAAAVAVFSFLGTVRAAQEAPPAKPAESPTAGTTNETKLALPEVVAVVDGYEISRAALEEKLDQTVKASGGDSSSLTPAQKMKGYHMILDQMITEHVIAEKAKDEEVTDKDVEAQFDQIKKQFPDEEALNKQIAEAGETVEGVKKDIRNSLKQQKWIDEQIGDETNVTDKDAETFYNENPDQFKMPAMVRASHILVMVPPDATKEVQEGKEKQIKAAAARIAKGEDFAKVAREVSEDPGSKDSGGDLNFFSKDRMVPEFADAAFKLEKDKVSEPVKSQFGYHLIKVTDKKEPRTITFDEVKDRIISYLKEQKRRDAITGVLETARKKASVKINLPAAGPAASPKAADSEG